MRDTLLPPASFAAKAAEVAGLLKAIGNPHRLMVLCRLTERGTASVGELVETAGLSQSALSQHLARMREEGLLTFERDGQTLWYRIADPRVVTLLATLYDLYCAPGLPAPEGKTQ
jgi:ArsR family transcriptional regulator